MAGNPLPLFYELEQPGSAIPMCHAERSEASPVSPHDSLGTRDASLRSAWHPRYYRFWM